MSRMRLLNESSGQTFEGFCLVKSASVKTNIKGTEYLDLILADSEGDCAGKLWDYNKELHGVFEANDVVKVRGSINIWKDTEQLKIDKIRHTTPEDNVDLSKLLPCSPFDPEWLYEELFTLAENFTDDDLRRLVQYIMRENKEKLLFYPAAVKLHHATRGGWLHHTWTLTKLAKAIIETYPALDGDLVAVVHGDMDHVVRQLTDDVGEEAGRENIGAGLLDLRGHRHGDAGLQIVAGQLQIGAGADVDALQRRDGALRGDGARGDGDARHQQRFFTVEFHGRFLAFSEKK